MSEEEQPQQFLTAADIAQAHNVPGGDAWLKERGYEDALNKYLSAVSEGRSWDPNDMSNVPPTPVASQLHKSGMRETVSVTLPDDGEELPPYEEWRKDDLIAECNERGIDATGTKDDMAMRLMEYDATEDAKSDDSEDEPNISPDYDLLKRGELLQILRKRELPGDGKNDELIARLREDDARRRNG